MRKAFATRSLLAEPTLDAVRDQLAKRRASEPKLSFIDLGFRPQAESIDGVSRAAEKGVQGGAAPKGKLGDPRQYSWKRPPDFLGDSYQVFVEGLIPSDVCQGSLGNCWFMCSLASLAEFPHLIEKLYESSWSDTPDGRVAVGGACEHGAYEVTICKNGAWTPVRVDDFFPCRPGEGNGPVFSRASGPELWVLLMEKAYAKLHGSYFALRSGVCFEGLMDLTGAPTFHKEFEREAVTFEMLQGWDLDNFVVCCSTPGVDTLTEGGGKDKKAGLVPGHAYSLISARVLPASFGGARLVKLRNPWGNFEWDGAWSDNSPEMTDEVRAELDRDPALDDGDEEDAVDDGIFWMSFDDFKAHFFMVSVCMAHVPHGTRKPRRAKKDDAWDHEMEGRAKTFLSNDATAGGGGEGKDDGDGHAADGKLRAAHFCELTVEAETAGEGVRCLIGTHQVDPRCAAAPALADVGVTLFHEDYTPVPDASKSGSLHRDALLDVTLTAGKYLVVPTTSGSIPAPKKSSRLRSAARIPASSASKTVITVFVSVRMALR